MLGLYETMGGRSTEVIIVGEVRRGIEGVKVCAMNRHSGYQIYSFTMLTRCSVSESARSRAASTSFIAWAMRSFSRSASRVILVSVAGGSDDSKFLEAPCSANFFGSPAVIVDLATE